MIIFCIVQNDLEGSTQNYQEGGYTDHLDYKELRNSPNIISKYAEVYIIKENKHNVLEFSKVFLSKIKTKFETIHAKTFS